LYSFYTDLELLTSCFILRIALFLKNGLKCMRDISEKDSVGGAMGGGYGVIQGRIYYWK